jgi:hypothetical protein
VNLGYPLVGPEAEIVSRARSVTPFGGGDHDPAALRVVAPGPDVRSAGHVHDLAPDAEGYGEGALLNDRLGLGLLLRFPLAALPSFRQWKALMNGRYVVALEPANYVGGNRSQARERDTLQTLEPGEVRTFHLEITTLRGAEELAATRERLRVGA